MLGKLSAPRKTVASHYVIDGVNLAVGISAHADLPLQSMSMRQASESDVVLVDGEFFAFDGDSLDDDEEAALATCLRDAESEEEISRVLAGTCC